MNPMQIMQLLQTTNNPMMLLQHFSGNPIMQRAMQMGQGKSEEQLRETARNLARQNGMDDNAFNQFIGQFGMKP